MSWTRPVGAVSLAVLCSCGPSASSAQGDAGAGATGVIDSGADAATMTDSAMASGDVATAIDARALVSDAALPGWTLTWSDEFNGADGSAVDPSKWIHDVGGGGWGNNELEYYTDGTQNAVVQGGDLVITATTAGASSYTCSGAPCKYTSARLLTKGKFSQQYGRFEARIQIPFGQGLWPAFWLLGDNIDQVVNGKAVGWPACGETDIMENIGREPAMNHGSLHAPGFSGSGLTGTYTLAGSARLADAFHTFAVEWDAAGIRFYVDDQLYETQTPGNVPAGGTWAFDHAFFILLNVAVGGAWPGNPNTTTTFPQTMKVDWVRVYRKGP